MSAALRVTPAKTAETVAAVAAVTVPVATLNVALVAPAATLTLAGTVAAVELLESVTSAPPLGAAALRLTVPVEAVPPTTLVGLSKTVESVGAAAAAGSTVSTALRVMPPNVLLIFAVMVAATR